MSSNIIRKISIGPDYMKSMNYSVGQKVIRKWDNGVESFHEIVHIKEVEKPETSDTPEYLIFIENSDEEYYEWKKVQNMPVVVEYVTDFEGDEGSK